MSRDIIQSTRRKFLGSMTLTVFGGLAGCLGEEKGNTSDTTPSSTISSTSTSTEASPTATSTSVVKTAEPTPTSRPTAKPTSKPTQSKPLSPPFVKGKGTTKYGIDLSGAPVMGKNPNAPVHIYYWSDYQCSYCKQFELGKHGALPKLVRNEIADGKVNIAFLQYPNYGDHSWTAGVMAKCIWRKLKDKNPDLFWKWHHTVFDHQELDGGEWSSRKSLLKYARKIKGIDARAVDQCMRTNRKQLESDLKKERKRGKKEGFANTPGFVLYHPKTDRQQIFKGAQPYTSFQKQIQAFLNQ